MRFPRAYTRADRPVHEQIAWKTVPAKITEPEGRVVFELAAISVPERWSETAVNVLAQKYLRRRGVPQGELDGVETRGMPTWLWPREADPGVPTGGETAAHQVFHRLAGCWAYWGWREGLLTEEDEARAFYDETYYQLALGIAAPNSPQWFNTGLHWAYGITGDPQGNWAVAPNGTPFPTTSSYEHPQPHACFIQPVKDDLVNPGGMMDLWTREARLFKLGSGSGSNLSAIRGKGEPLSGGGRSSGLMSFLEVGDRSAGSIQSGGTTRRAALMRCLDLDHPEVREFIWWKVREEAKAAAIAVGSRIIAEDPAAPGVPEAMRDRAEAGIPSEVHAVGWEGEAVRTVSGQNSNNSVRVTDEFLRRVDADEPWELTARTTGKTVATLPARELWSDVVRAAWASADPGVQFHDAINAWHTCPNDGPINASNPCFTGDTLVWTIDGSRRFDELAASGDTVNVLTELADGSLAYRPMHRPRLTRRAAKVVKITLKSKYGQGGRQVSVTELRLTPDHVLFLRSGERRRAIDLKPGDRIESAYRTKANQKGYIRLRATSGDSVMEHHVVAELDHGRRPVWPLKHGHHVDEIKDRNVAAGNVEIVGASEHNSEHMPGDRNPMRRWFGSLDEAARARHLKKMSEAISGEKNPNYGNRGHLSDRVWITDGTKSYRITTDADLPEGWRYARPSTANHEVVSIEDIEEVADVYCGTVPATGRFFVSLGDRHYEGVLVANCSEYMFLDDTACNLASVRLTAFLNSDGGLDLDAYEAVVRLWTAILEVSVFMASFPSREIAERSFRYRTLGLGPMDLGGLLMRSGLPYDSDAGRALGASLTALMTATAYRTSAEMAGELGPFTAFHANEEPFRRVMEKHARAVRKVSCAGQAGAIVLRAEGRWMEVLGAAGFRNAQVTLAAPTGTISLVTDCDVSGIEPDFSLVKTKLLAGGGRLVLVNPAVEPALRRLGYREENVRRLVEHARERGTLEGSSLDPNHLAVFDTANAPPGATRFIAPMGHVRMMAALQPFLSGAISKTVNLPRTATVADVDLVYREAHRLGVKSIALYRDGSKLTQPLSAVGKASDTPVRSQSAESGRAAPAGREYLPWRRERGFTQKVKIAGSSIWLRVSEYDDGRPGEVFLELAHEGSTLRAMANLVAIAISIGLQHRVPVAEYVDRLVHTKFEPAGVVEGHDRIKLVSSIGDYVGRELGLTYLGREELANVAPAASEATAEAAATFASNRPTGYSGDVCDTCQNATMVRVGSCLRCDTCGATTGCG